MATYFEPQGAPQVLFASHGRQRSSGHAVLTPQGRQPEGPALLVSVRTAEEAADALAGGCDILDVKEPGQGPLGFAGFAIVRAVASVAQSAGIPCTAAFGEVADWPFPAGREIRETPFSLSYAKIGLAGLVREPRWIDRWLSARRTVEAAIGAVVPWVAVAYADWRDAASPSPFDVAEAALATGCAGLLIDTWDKSRGTLPDRLSPAEIAELGRRMRSAEKFIALAGSLREPQVEALLPLRPDVIAVRSAACREGRRSGPIDPQAVARLKRLLIGAAAATP